VSYARSQPARAPDGTYYGVCASPRGDLLLSQSETGPATWLSANVGVLGILGYLLNKAVYRGRWRVVVRQGEWRRSAGPKSGILATRDVPKEQVEPTIRALVTAVEDGSLPL
jgi:hypothetical protein